MSAHAVWTRSEVVIDKYISDVVGVWAVDHRWGNDNRLFMHVLELVGKPDEYYIRDIYSGNWPNAEGFNIKATMIGPYADLQKAKDAAEMLYLQLYQGERA